MATVHRQNLTQLKGSRLQIYTRSDTNAPWWHARTRDPNGRSYLTKSLKTTDQATAVSKAEGWYEDLQFRIDQGLIIKSRTADQVCDIYVKELEEDVQRGDRPQRHLKELYLILGDAAWSGGAGFGGVDDGDTIGELDAFNDLRQLISPVQPPPGL